MNTFQVSVMPVVASKTKHIICGAPLTQLVALFCNGFQIPGIVLQGALIRLRHTVVFLVMFRTGSLSHLQCIDVQITLLHCFCLD